MTSELIEPVELVVPVGEPTADELQLARDLVSQAKEQGADLSASRFLRALTQSVIQTALGEEMVEHLGYEKHDPVYEHAREIREA